MLPQLERQFLQADLAQVQGLLAQCEPGEDVIEHFQYSQRARELEFKLAAMSKAVERAPAGVALFFGGGPVVGSLGIHSDFSSKVIERFQTIVSQRFAAQELGPLASKGRVPLKDNSHLLVTDVVRGSFGFVLQAAPQDEAVQPVETTLKAVLDRVANTIYCVAAQDDALFDDAVSEIDERQKGALSDFFKLLDAEGATMRIVEGERDFELDRASVQRACRRVENLHITEQTRELVGQIVGWTDYSAKFELMLHEGRSLVQGSVAPRALERVALERLEPYHKHVRLSVKVREATARNRQPKTAYTLLSLEPHHAPADWPSESNPNAVAS